ncbi:MAG: hypothetical protein KAU21_02235 [Gammaproteobacteria bacterium]|nr:hypothetical protein [Gammaproteobacteria bacterium]
MLLINLGSAQAGFYGRIDGRVQADTYLNDSGFVEETADIRFVDKQRGIESGLSLAFRQGDENEANLYQLYLEKSLEGLISSYKLGRFERADSLGFYTLDGGVLKSSSDDFLFTLYAGKPSRIDDYTSVDGDALYGFDVHFENINLSQLSSSILFNTAVARIGWQRLEDDAHETRLNWGLNGSGEIKNSVLHGFGLTFNGSYLSSDNTTEQLQFKLYGDMGKRSRVQIDYETFSLDEPYLSFREQYYSVYANGRQTSLAASYYFKQNTNTKWITKGRTVLRELGENGYGASLGVELREYSGTEYVAQLDYLSLDEDRVVSLYGETSYSFSALIKSRFSAAIQSQDKWLSGNNQAVGVEANLQQMLRSGLYLTLSLSSVWNTHLDDDYLFALNLSYRFDERKKWWSDE